ncbi:MAG: hypothetical protein JO264_09180 [Acidisphaera sp.]|nr:hypothetical protein [Acidisphaera sp.]
MAEQSKTESADAAAPQSEGGKRVYERSTIEFPYNDLNDSVEIAKAIHQNAGMSCALDQLAAYLHVSMTGGAFNGRVANAGTFRVAKRSGGMVTLTPVGCRIVDPSTEAEARAEAFLSVPLYAAIHDKYRGYTLPPPAALEREMALLGVAAKQTDKARQAFMRSAQQAGFFIHGEDRLVRPSFTASPTTKPIELPPEQRADEKSGGGGGKPPLDPLLRGLVDRLPTADTEWGLEDRVKWLQTAANIFDLIYKGGGGIKIEAAMAHRSPRPE